MPTVTVPEVGEVIAGDPGTEVAVPWNVILYNDDWHTIDEVVLQVQKATGYALERAVAITLEVHESGRAVVFTGDKENAGAWPRCCARSDSRSRLTKPERQIATDPSPPPLGDSG